MNITKSEVAVLGAGFIGKALIDGLLRSGRQVSVLDRNPAPDGLDPRVRWSRASFGDAAALSGVLDGCVAAFHLVADSVPGDRRRDDGMSESELAAMDRFVDACAESGVEHIVFMSSASVYGEQSHLPIPEDAPALPLSAHGAQKLALERRLFARVDGGPGATVLRLANPYGPGQRTDGRQGFIALAIGRIMAGQPVSVRDAGRAIRDFIHIDDAVDACLHAMGGAASGRVVNIGSGKGHSLAEVLALMESITGRPVAREELPARDADIRESVLDVSVAAEILGFRAQVGLETGLRRLLAYHGLTDR